FFFSSRRRHTRFSRDWSSDVCSSDLRRFPLDHRAPEMQNRLIAAYTKGAFARDVLLAKQDYVQAYGIGSAYWQQADAPQQQTLQIGRASCREKVDKHVRGESITKTSI